TADARHGEIAHRKRDAGRRGIERPRRGPGTRAEGRRHERDGEEDAERPGGDHGSQVKSSHLAWADWPGSIVLATSPAALVTAWCQVMQPTVPWRVRSIIPVTSASGSAAVWVMFD